VAVTLEDMLAPGGPLAKHLGGDFEPRPEQRRMAHAVEQAFGGRTHLLVEAGTGVGKSFAYLLPAMLRCARAGERVVVATNTIALQEQLVQKDIPLLLSVLAAAGIEEAAKIRPVLVKGRGNYVSIRRLELASKRQDRLFADAAARRSLHVIEDWAYTTTDGTLSTLPPLERAGVWDKVNSDSGNCMGRRCPRFEQCFYQKARAELDGANLLICNHALYFSDLALRAQETGFLPEHQHIVLDEVHAVEDVASEHFGVTLAEGRVAHLLSTLSHARTGKGYLPGLGLLAGDADAVGRAIRLVEQASDAARAFFDDCRRLVRPASAQTWTLRGSRNSGEPRTLRLREPGLISNVLTPALRELSLRLKTLRDLVKDDADRYELNSYAQRAELIASDAEVLVSQALPGCVYWAELTGGDDSFLSGGPRVEIAAAPIEVGPILRERLFSSGQSVILTSATLATREARAEETGEAKEAVFGHVLSRLGCEGAGTLQLGSPFDFAHQMEVLLTRFDPSRRRPVEEDEPVFRLGAPRREPDLSPLSAAILHHVRATEGGAFVLFTSLSQLAASASELAGPLAAAGLPLLAQGRDGSRSSILQRFRENDRSVLFGAASFWQGVDVRGRGLRNVIITRLPFDPPDRPLTQARGELIESRGGNPFLEDSLPRAVIKFKQGIGRLIRSRTDHGRVVVLDPRLVTARYGRSFMGAFPPGVRPVIDGEDTV